MTGSTSMMYSLNNLSTRPSSRLQLSLQLAAMVPIFTFPEIVSLFSNKTILNINILRVTQFRPIKENKNLKIILSFKFWFNNWIDCSSHLLLKFWQFCRKTTSKFDFVLSVFVTICPTQPFNYCYLESEFDSQKQYHDVLVLSHVLMIS